MLDSYRKVLRYLRGLRPVDDGSLASLTTPASEGRRRGTSSG
jgi:hypothetical protein